MNYLCIKRPSMKILVTNDDGYNAKGLRTLVKILRPYGEITVVAPKQHQSGMSMAVNLGQSPIPVKKISEVPGERWWYIGGTPSSCVKYGIDNIFYPEKPDVVVSGINHGAISARPTSIPAPSEPRRKARWHTSPLLRYPSMLLIRMRISAA